MLSVFRARTYWVVGESGIGKKVFERKTSEGQTCLYLNDKVLYQGICHDLEGEEKKDAWLERVAHICKAANDSGVSVIVESLRSPDGTVRVIIGEQNLEVTR
jgi:adenylylsulfate kinase-like enzyme